MSWFAKRRVEEEPGGGGAGMPLDLELRVCPACARELHAWEGDCPACGEQGVPKRSAVITDLPPPPAHLLADLPEDPDDPAGHGGPP